MTMLKTIGTVVVLLFCALCGIPTAAATYDGITVSATADGRSVSASNSNEPIRLRPGEPVDVAIELTNPTSAPVEVRQVELVGRVVGLNFFTYATSVDFTVPAANSDTFHYRLDLTGLRGQATGLIGGQLIIRDAAGNSIATVPMVTDVRGSVLSVYGLFGIALLVLTVLALIDAAFGIATHRLSANRWQRGLRLLAPGIGVGLVLTFSASVARLWVPDGGRWLLIGGLTAAAFFAIGYFAPVPGDEGTDADLDADLDADDLSEHVDTDELAGDKGADADLDADDLSEHVGPDEFAK
jgi:hypothetical protein